MSVDPISLGITIALTAANHALTASRKIEGQRLDDLSVTVADYGVPCNYFVGTRRFDGVPIIWAEKLKEIKVKRKTKGGKLTNYEYLATFMFEVADHPCDAVTRIWFDKQLVYDITGSGPPSLFSIKKGFVLADHLRIYLGAEDQMPDPRMQATVDAEHGVGSTPAYRGKTTGVFEEIPVDKFGNRIPQIMVEAARSVNAAYPYTSIAPIVEDLSGVNGPTISPSLSALYWATTSQYGVIDLPSRTILHQGSLGQNITLSARVGVKADGTFLAVSSGNNKLLQFDPNGSMAGTEIYNFGTSSTWQSEVRVLIDGNGTEHWMTRPWATVSKFFFDGDLIDPPALTGVSWQPSDFFVDGYGDIWAVGAGPVPSLTTAYFYRLVDTGARPGSDGFLAVTGLPALGATIAECAAVHYRDSAVDQFVFNWNFGRLVAVNIETGAINANVAASLDIYGTRSAIGNAAFGASSLWIMATEYSLADLSVLRTVNYSSWLSQPVNFSLYDPIGHALVGSPAGPNFIVWRCLDRVSGSGTTLRSLVETVHSLGGMDAADADATMLTSSVRGYNWTQGSGQDILDPVLELHDVDARPHGFLLHYQPRGGASGAAIFYDNFAQVDADSAPYIFAGAGGTDLPRSISLTYADADADQEPNSARASRPLDVVDGLEREQSIDMNTLVLTSSEAKAMTDRLHRRQMFDTKPYQLPLTAQYVDLEPGDVRQLSLPSGVVTARLKSMAMDADRTISTEWLRDDPSVAVLGNPEGAAMAGHVPQEIVIPAPSRVAILDVPMATDVHDGAVPFLYFGAGPYGSGYFPGADIAISDSGLESDFEASWASVASNAAMDWGYSVNSLSTSALPWIMDNATVLNVEMQNGTLTSVTDAQLLADGLVNLALVGGEYIQFRTATLQSDGTYNLSGLLRGRRGTEHEIPNHAAGDQFILMNADIGRREVGAGEIGDFDAWRAATSGRDIDGAFETSLTFAANAHRPYSPVQGIALRDTGSGDWSINANRRTRVGGNQWLGGTLPLGEASESWQADIMDGAVVKRTLTGTSLPLTYTAAQQTADWGAGQTSLTVKLYQMNPTLGLRGFPLNIAA